MVVFVVQEAGRKVEGSDLGGVSSAMPPDQKECCVYTVKRDRFKSLYTDIQIEICKE